MELSRDGQSFANQEKINLECYCLAISGGWTPAVHLFTQSGGKLKFRDEDQVFIPSKYPSDQISVGSCNEIKVPLSLSKLAKREITSGTL